MAEQPTLLPENGKIDSNTPFSVAAEAFNGHMKNEGFSIHTIKAFKSDLRLIGGYVGNDTAVGAIGTKDLNDFLTWLLTERGVPCSPKSYARRVTTIKVFFGWLETSETLAINPSNKVAQRTVTTPLPTLPSAEDVQNAVDLSKSWTVDGESGRVDSRPYMLLTLLLETGIKKGEGMALELDHIIRDEEEPYIFIKYKNPKMQYKERKIDISTELLTTIDQYIAEYNPESTLFTCTPRNLEYVLSDISEELGFPKGALSFENVRWLCAYHDYTTGMDHETLRQKLGLSKVTWRETKRKLGKLAGQAEDNSAN